MYDLEKEAISKGILSDIEFPRLVSYPRTGSHWFRILVEKYTGSPSYFRSFYTPNPSHVWGFHIHNRQADTPDKTEGIIEGLKKVIYLYRNPIDTIFSLLKYDNILPSNWNTEGIPTIRKKVIKFSKEYEKHLNFWLNNKHNAEKIIYVKYEDLKNNPKHTFKQILDFLQFDWDPERFDWVYKSVSKASTKSVTQHDYRVVNSEQLLTTNTIKKQKLKFKELFESDIKLIFKEYYESKKI